MGRGRGKGKKLTVVSHEDSGSGEEEKIPVQKRRGRPQKPMKDDIDEEQIERIEEDEIDIKGTSLPSRERSAVVGRVKRKRNSQANSTPTPVKEEIANDADKPNAGDSTKPNEIRHSGSRRRKSTPHRAAEAEVIANVSLDLGPLASKFGLNTMRNVESFIANSYMIMGRFFCSFMTMLSSPAFLNKVSHFTSSDSRLKLGFLRLLPLWP